MIIGGVVDYVSGMELLSSICYGRDQTPSTFDDQLLGSMVSWLGSFNLIKYLRSLTNSAVCEFDRLITRHLAGIFHGLGRNICGIDQ